MYCAQTEDILSQLLLPAHSNSFILRFSCMATGVFSQTEMIPKPQTTGIAIHVSDEWGVRGEKIHTYLRGIAALPISLDVLSSANPQLIPRRQQGPYLATAIFLVVLWTLLTTVDILLLLTRTLCIIRYHPYILLYHGISVWVFCSARLGASAFLTTFLRMMMNC